MADSKLAVSQWSPDFVQDLLPAAQKTALLYHLSYLCLANFPNLERIIRARAVETQLLFGSSEATMLKCVLTSENLVKSLFPILIKVVEKNSTVLAIKFLGKAKVCIKDIVTDVDRIVEKYESHNKDVASSTSDVIQEKEETDKKITEQDKELELAEEALKEMKSKLQKTTAELADNEKMIRSKSQEIQDFARSITKKSKGLGIFAAFVPFIGAIVKKLYKALKNPGDAAQLKALEAQLNVLISNKTDLKQKQWQIELQIIDQQMKVTRARFDKKSIPKPVHLPEVQKSLSKIQDILIQLKTFWQSIGQMLDYLEKHTFVKEELIEDLSTFKEDFIDSINSATEAWSSFGAGCQRASAIFRLQNKDVYKFLEVSPSSLSKEEWQKQYKSVKKQLEDIDRSRAVTSVLAFGLPERMPVLSALSHGAGNLG